MADELGKAGDEEGLKAMHVVGNVAVAVADDAAVRTVGGRADAAEEELLVGGDVGDSDGLDADEDEHAVECGEVGDEAGEVGGDAGDEVGVDEADAGDPGDAEAGAEGEEPVQGDLVVEVELVLLDGGVVPHEHDSHEEEGEQDGEPRPLQELDQRRREVERLDGEEEEEEGQRHRRAFVPAQNHHQRRQARRHQHHRHHRQPCMHIYISSMKYYN